MPKAETKKQTAGPNAELDALLATLKKHGVAEYSQDQFGTKVRFAPEPFKLPEGLSLEEIAPQKTVFKQPTPYNAPPVPTEELPSPSKSVDIERLPLDDLLPAGGQ